ncbi:hypothetical protein [Psychrilyobacter atlanticus]|uniref:hypothetical protein n=1 Tax=Psychrilyobacter atlanticus TaxID=271091 RepID=UPI00041D019B|nr:hypothetical protein [Psychrilyobacter atlanticus]
MKKIILVLIFIICESITFSTANLDVDISGGLDFDYIVIPDSGSNNSTILADRNGVIVSFVSSKPTDTVSVSFSGGDIRKNKLFLDSENITIEFISSTGKWNEIPTDLPFYIGGMISIKDTATGNNEIDENIIITVTSESIN